MLLHRVILFCTLLLSVVCDLRLAEAAEVPYIVFSDANISGLAVPSSSSSTEVETLTLLGANLQIRYSCTAVSTRAH